ncbi:unnamed protein product [Schistocephalus solidus]|uniref:Secreted protein n=1 Tax=Schistocephalus solidus TaxID=70667 RepID=A0A183SDT8_SCHSO|nr:unnamed protein product [Schistocephalus solidus]
MAISGLLAVISQPYPTPGAAAPEARTRDLLGRSLTLYPLRHYASSTVVFDGVHRMLCRDGDSLVSHATLTTHTLGRRCGLV